MSSDREHDFDEAQLSGYLDGMLTQQDMQHVRLHLETCASCNQVVSEMRELREVTMTTTFSTPPDDQWNERPRGTLSRLSFGLGWAILIAWVLGILGFTLGQLWSGPESLTEKILIFGSISGFALLLLSVVIDRLKNLESDRYRGVQK